MSTQQTSNPRNRVVVGVGQRVFVVNLDTETVWQRQLRRHAWSDVRVTSHKLKCSAIVRASDAWSAIEQAEGRA